ncbi:MAG: hypothetical protein QOI38_2728 [Sphingomonadales bacterium]|nr:hypothetical protein [Sphingomonadales bacterium]
MPSTDAKAFRARHKADASYRPFTDADRERLGDRLPTVMREILEQDGWSSYDDQAMWLCDPDDWKKACRPWLPDESRACDVLARSSFGDLLAWGGDKFWLVMPHSSTRIAQTADPRWLFGETLQRDDFYFNDEIPADTAAARKACGPLGWQQMYDYDPPLANGGSREKSRIGRRDARKALRALAKLAPVQSVYG